VLILRILRKENRIPPPRMALIMGLAGGSNALILSTINSAAQHAGRNGPDLQLLIMFTLCLLVYIIAQRHVMSAAMCEIERIVNDLRIRLIAKVRHSELACIERLVPSDVLTTIAKEPVAISNLAPGFVAAGQASLLLLFVTGYVAYLSITALTLTAMAAFFAISIFLRRSEKLRTRLRHTAEQDAEVFEGLDDLLSGFKEVKMSSTRGDAPLSCSSSASSRSIDELAVASAGIACTIIEIGPMRNRIAVVILTRSTDSMVVKAGTTNTTVASRI